MKATRRPSIESRSLYRCGLLELFQLGSGLLFSRAGLQVPFEMLQRFCRFGFSSRCISFHDLFYRSHPLRVL